MVEDHFRELVGYAVRRVGSPDDASDIVAETMLVAWRRIDEVPPGDRARLWLYGVARRVVANHRRGQLRRQQLSERLSQQVVEVMPDPSDAADSIAAVRQALARLSDDDRELIMLTAWDGLDPREAAVVLDVPARTIRTRLHRARARLRRQLGDAFDDGGHVLSDQQAQPVQEER
jgi:RNA polymerase sigma-70 factor (ECF subfamily)